MPINLGYRKISYRNTVSILVFQAKVVNFQETKLLACLIEENATRCLWLQWKVIAISNTVWYKSKNLRQIFCDNLSIRMTLHVQNQCENVDEKWENPFISAHQIFEEQDMSRFSSYILLYKLRLRIDFHIVVFTKFLHENFFESKSVHSDLKVTKCIAFIKRRMHPIVH